MRTGTLSIEISNIIKRVPISLFRVTTYQVTLELIWLIPSHHHQLEKTKIFVQRNTLLLFVHHSLSSGLHIIIPLRSLSNADNVLDDMIMIANTCLMGRHTNNLELTWSIGANIQLDGVTT
jgi:hypothetical protein